MSWGIAPSATPLKPPVMGAYSRKKYQFSLYAAWEVLYELASEIGLLA